MLFCVLTLTCGDDGGVRAEHEVDARVWHCNAHLAPTPPPEPSDAQASQVSENEKSRVVYTWGHDPHSTSWEPHQLCRGQSLAKRLVAGEAGDPS